MMRKLADRSVVPPDGWSYWQDETKQWLRSGDWLRLLSAVERHRAEHNLPIGPLFEEEVEHQIASRPDSHSVPRYVPEVVASRRTTIAQIRDFMTTAGAWLKGGMDFVPRDEAERRATICVQCPENTEARGGCSGCLPAINKVAKVFTKIATTRDAQLQACAVCGCSLPVMVHIPLEHLSDRTGTYPAHCWKLGQEVIDPLDEPADGADAKDDSGEADGRPDSVEQVE